MALIFGEEKIRTDTTFLVSKISNLFLHDAFCDVTLLAKNADGSYKKFPVHRIILGACSAYWKALLLGKYKEAKENDVKLEDVDSNTLVQVLSYVYCGKVELGPNNIADMIVAAAKFQMDTLFKVCKSYVLEDMALNICCSVIDVSCTGTDIDALKAQCLNYVLENASELTKLPEHILYFSQDTLVSLVGSTGFQAEEHDIFLMVQRWCAAHAKDDTDTEEMRQLYAPFEQLIRYSLLHPYYVQNLVRPSRLVSDSLLLDAWAVAHGQHIQGHSSWKQPRMDILTWDLSWSTVEGAVGGSYTYFTTQSKQYKDQNIALRLYLNSKDSQKHLWLSVYLYLPDQSIFSKNKTIETTFKIILENKVEPLKSPSQMLKEHRFASGADLGRQCLVRRDQLQSDQSKQTGLIQNDIISFQVIFYKFKVVPLAL